MTLHSASYADQISVTADTRPACIDVTDQRAIDHLARQWGVTEFELRCAVAAAGDAPDDVRSHLGLG